MPLEILPDSLHSLSSCELLLQSKESSLFHKSLSSSLIDKKMYLSSIAILLVKKGQQVVHNYDSANLIVAENEIVILPKDIYVVSDFVTKEHCFEAFICFVDDELIKKFLLFHTLRNGVNQKESKLCKVRSNQKINRYIDLLFDTYRTKHGSPSSLHELKLIEFLMLLVDSDDDMKVTSSLTKPTRKRSIKEFMESNYLGNLKVADYAALTGRSLTTFTREFRRLYGTSPNKWLIQKRLQKSSELLEKTSMSVTEVAMEVGYENVSHFIKAYKRLFGATPKRYKSERNG